MLKENKILESLLRFGRKIIPCSIFNFFQPFYHLLLGLFAVVLYRFPSKKLILIGVTGTKGKSTVVYLISKILEEGGQKAASISSIEFKVGKKAWSNPLKMTMPGRFKLQKFLRDVIQAGCKYVILEVTSEGIEQHRHRFIDFDGAVFTNLSKEHLEVHGGFENYKKAKGKLFKALAKSKKKNKFAIFNADDKNSEYYAKLAGNVKKIFYKKNLKIKIQLPGEFNLYNAAAAVEIAKSLGLSIGKTIRTLKNVKEIPGRMEMVIKKPFTVIVDYAHTPDSLEKVYNTIQPSEAINQAKRSTKRSDQPSMICVLGAAGGGRDKWKRPEMGKIAAKYCDKIILTNEDPYDENPLSILDEIESGFSQILNSKFQILKILDRRKAINKALSLAKKGDTVIITGKGCESWICVEHGKKISWDDRKVVMEEFKKL